MSATRADQRSTAEAVLDVLLAWNIRQVFICPGSTEAAFLDASLARPEFQVVLTTHESVTVAMADGYARATGTPALAYLHTHLGLANGLANTDAARLGHSPVVLLTGLKPASVQAHDGFTTLAGTGELARPFVKRHWQSLTAGTVPDDLTQALRLCSTEPCGPVWLGLAQDIMEQPCDAPVPDPARYPTPGSLAPDPDRLRAAAELLRDARKPVLVAGSEVARHGATPAVLRLAERLGAAVCNEDRRGFERPGCPTGHPNYAGAYHPDNPVVTDSDLLFFLGCRCFVEFEPPEAAQLPAGATVIQSHVDAEQLARVHGVDVALRGDETLIAEELLKALPRREDVERSAPPTPEPDVHPERSEHATVDEVARALAEVVDENTTVIEDATTSEVALLRQLPQSTPDSFLTSSSGSLGWGLGAALGFQLGAPDRHVLAVLGDGVFQFGVPALWTAAHYRIPVTFLVINNQSYAAVAAALRRYGGTAARTGEYPGKDISGVRIAAVAEGFGIPARRFTHAAHIPGAVKEFRDSGGPGLIEVLTDPDYLGAAPK